MDPGLLPGPENLPTYAESLISTFLELIAKFGGIRATQEVPLMQRGAPVLLFSLAGFLFSPPIISSLQAIGPGTINEPVVLFSGPANIVNNTTIVTSNGFPAVV